MPDDKQPDDPQSPDGKQPDPPKLKLWDGAWIEPAIGTPIDPPRVADEAPTYRVKSAYDPSTDYMAKLKLWGLGALAALLFVVANALVTRWIGPQPSLPAPPPVPLVVTVEPSQQPGEGPRVTFHKP